MNTPYAPQAGTQILALTGLRFDANLGILEHEKVTPQPIQVDASFNSATSRCCRRRRHPHVQDFRKVRIIDECANTEPAGEPDRQTHAPPDAAARRDRRAREDREAGNF
jgi:hypothetical protein